jgi:hypothetical protein
VLKHSAADVNAFFAQQCNAQTLPAHLWVHYPIIAPPLDNSTGVGIKRPQRHGVVVHGGDAHLVHEPAEAAGDRADKMIASAESEIILDARDAACARAYVLASSHMLLKESRAYSVVFTLGSLPGKPGQRLMVTPIGAYT